MTFPIMLFSRVKNMIPRRRVTSNFKQAVSPFIYFLVMLQWVSACSKSHMTDFVFSIYLKHTVLILNLRRAFSSTFFRTENQGASKFEVLSFTLRKTRKHNFPRRRGGLAKRVVNFMDSEMYLLAS